MADESQTSTPAPEAAAPAPIEAAAPPSEPTPQQAANAAFSEQITGEIDDLWAKLEGRAPEPSAPAPEPEQPKAEAPNQDISPKTDEPPKAETKPADDPAELRRQAYEQAKAEYEAAERTKAEAERRVRQEAEHRQAADAYVGSDDEYQAVNLAMRQAFAGDTSALYNLDVLLPNGKRVSEVKGAKGLTEEEAANLLTAWDTARRFQDVLGDRKVRHLVDLWNADIVSARVLDHPDVDMAAVTQHSQPHDQMAALRDSVIERVTKRLTAQHDEVIKAKDAEIKKQADRIESLLTERGNLTAQRAGQDVATVDRPGQPGALRGPLPSPEELASMPADELFKTGNIDRILRAIDGGLSPRRRTA